MYWSEPLNEHEKEQNSMNKKPSAESVLNIIAGYVMTAENEESESPTISARVRGHNDIKKGIREILAKYTNIRFN